MLKIGCISLYGCPSQGKISAVENTVIGRKIEFGNVSRLSFVLCNELGDLRTVSFDELANYGICASLAPKCSDNDAFAILSLKMTVPENISVDEMHFTLPEFKIGDNDILMLPSEAGMRYKNPAKALFSPIKRSWFDWMDRRSPVLEGGLMEKEIEDASEQHRENKASMQFADYYSEDGDYGLYLGTDDPNFEKTFFDFSAKRDSDLISLTIKKHFNRHIDNVVCDIVIGLHKGDWHIASDYYRKFFDTTEFKILHSTKVNPGMSCHYDLMWQNGAVNHHYTDLPEVARIARTQGYDTVLCAGWQHGGFDRYYPDFRPEPELGTEEELIEAVKEIHKNGSKILFYVNAYSFDNAFEEFKEFGYPAAIKIDKNGKTHDEPVGSQFLTSMCPSSEWWREKVLDNVRYVVEVLGADGIYLDQLNLQPPKCYDKNHIHDRSAILANSSLAEEIRRLYGKDLILLSEWVIDAMASVLDLQLIHTAWRNIEYAYPEFFRYTFPTAGLVDQILQKPWHGDDMNVEGRFVRDIFDRLFVTGIKFWTYDHVPYTPGFAEYFKAGIELRERYTDKFNEGIYLDDIELDATNNGVMAKTFALGDKRMLTVANKTGEAQTIRFKDGRTVNVPKDALSITVI